VIFKEKEWKGMKQDLLSEIEDLKSEKENMFLQIKELNDLNSRL